MTFRIRPLGEHDITAVLTIQAESYPQQLRESAEIIRQRLHSSPELAMVAEDAEGVCAYLFGYRSYASKVMLLDGTLAMPDATDHLYLHDLAVSARATGRGIGPALVEHLLANAHSSHLRHSALACIETADELWNCPGYQTNPVLAHPQCNHEPCSVSALYMKETLH